MARRFPYLIPALLALWWPVALFLALRFGLFQQNALILMTVMALFEVGKWVSWLSPLVALWVFWKVRWHWTLLVFLLADAFFVYLWFAL